MDFRIIGEGTSFPQAYSAEKCDMAAVADMLKD